MRDKDLNKGIGGLLDPGYASKEDLKKEELDRFYREHIENRKPHTAFKRPLSVSDYIPTPTLDVPEKTVVKPIVKTKEQPFRYEGWADGIIERTEPKNKFGDTKAQKEKLTNDWLTRPPDNNKKILKAKPKNMPILSYVDKMSVLYGGQEKRKYDDEGRPLKKEKNKGYTREFKSDDPTSFPSHEDQQKNMLVDVIADAKQTDKGKYIPWYDRVAQTKADNLNAIKKFGHEESQIKSPPPKKVTAQDIKKSEKDMTIERKNRDVAKKEKTNDG